MQIGSATQEDILRVGNARKTKNEKKISKK